MNNDPRKLTNAYIRQKLGEAGFIESQFPSHRDNMGNVSTWSRGLVTLRLFEYQDNSAPRLYNADTGEEIFEDQLGVRNENIQNDGSPDE